MTVPSHNPHLFRWRRLTKTNTPGEKVHLKNSDIDQWRQRVEKASEFAVSEVFFKKPHLRTNSLAVQLQSSDQLQDHDDAYSEAQTLLGDWLSSKLRLELEMEEDEDDLMRSTERKIPVAPAQPAALNHTNFDDLYNCLAEEEEESAVRSFLDGLMEREVLGCGLMEELSLDVGQTRKKFRDPTVTMKARHLQVRENRARREAERQRQQREREARQGAREEAKRREHEAEARKRQEARRQEELLQQEMVRLRREMEGRRGLEQLARQREREREEGQRAARGSQSAPSLPAKQHQRNTEQLYKDQRIHNTMHMRNLQCLQRHFSGWHSAVMERRLRLSKAVALCEWRRQLRAWRGWRAVAWAGQRQREVARMEQELRVENRRLQLAAENNRTRLLRRCLNEWQLWCRTERERRELSARQQETRRKMAALISAASTGKLKAADGPTCQPVMAPPEASRHPESTRETNTIESVSSGPETSAAPRNLAPVAVAAQPAQPWQVTRRHAAPSATQLGEARRRCQSAGFTQATRATSPGGRFESRHAVQQQIITQQRRLLKQQQEQIAELRHQQNIMRLEPELERTARSMPKHSNGRNLEASEQRAQTDTAAADSFCAPPQSKAKPARQTSPHPIITAMEARAQQRTRRRQEIEELKRKKEEEKLAEMKAAEERRQREEEEERRKAAEQKREERRQEREREEEKRRQLRRHQELMKLARQHHHTSLLLRRGLAPWKRLVQLRQAGTQLAERHHELSLLRRCTLAWQQAAAQSLSEKEASADQLYQHFLLRRSLSCWTRLMDRRTIQEERARRLYRCRALRRCLLGLLDHVTRERLVDRDRQALAQEHNDRRLLRRCFLAWGQLPSLLRKEREREKRREKLERRVAAVLPDFSSRLL